MTKKTLLTFAVIILLLHIGYAQDFPYGQISTEDLKMTKYVKDTSAHAVVLREYGRSQIAVANDDEIKLRFEYHVKIKIFDNKGFDDATKEIEIRNFSDNSQQDEVEKITGTTYFVDGTGAIGKTDFDPSKVYKTRNYKEKSTLKFTMPALTPGCIIEYKYTLVRPIGLCLDHFQPWEFQRDIPKVYSQYEALIPGHFTYNATLHGYLKLTETTADVAHGCFSASGSSSDCSDIKYGMSDVPAFVDEEYMTSEKNYLSSISFDLVEFTNPYNGSKIKGTKEWKDIDYNLKTEYSFGSQLKKQDVFKDRIVPVIAGKNDDLEKAKAVYAYIQQSFKWNNYIGIYSYDGVKKAYESHSGSIADINLALIDALKSAGINTEALLVSTRDNGFVSDLYPAINQFNYLIAKANIGDKSYFLDASDRTLPFGMLPFHCLNGKGRAFSMDKPSYWVDINPTQKRMSTSTMELTLTEDGKLKGTVIYYSVGYEAYETREAIKKFTAQDEYIADFGSKFPKIKILKAEISNLDSLDKPLVETYQVEINASDKTGSGNYSFNPFFMSKITTNPFKLAERTYPVDMGVLDDYRTILNVHLPAGYTVDSPPQNIVAGLPNGGGRFLTDFHADDNSFTFSHVIQLYKPVFEPAEYPYLKDFYNKIILSEKAEMIFKKK
ncbi:MAG TPA: DUF3857 domain-containing protein [Mucilaginibacter sp.]|jgi:hypothetical protein|nr:DUF3857 domain-containing protein [Mucilaginibacter sp.]